MKNEIWNFIVIPGNPGIKDYYASFQKWIQEFFPRSPVHILAYQGFQTHPPKRLLTIIEEKEDLEGRIAELIQNSDSVSSWILVGHSIGGWIVLEILSDWKKKKHSLFKRVKKIFLLFPFLALDPNSEKQSKLERRVNHKFLIAIVLGMYHLIRLFLPRIALRKILKKLTPEADEEVQKIHERYFVDCLHIPASVIHCARSEFATLEKDITQGLTVEKIHSLQAILHIFYTRGDLWAPEQQKDFLEQKLGKRFQGKLEFIGEVQHDFCIRSEESFFVAKRLYELLKNFH